MYEGTSGEQADQATDSATCQLQLHLTAHEATRHDSLEQLQHREEKLHALLGQYSLLVDEPHGKVERFWSRAVTTHMEHIRCKWQVWASNAYGPWWVAQHAREPTGAASGTDDS